MSFNRWIHIHFMRRGVHCYPEAATDPSLATGDKYDVSYLAHPHAHDFWFDVKVQVEKADRDIEFIQLRLRMEDWYGDGVLECGRKSCETMAEELIEKLADLYPNRIIQVGVYEDSLHGNGGIVDYIPE